MRFLPRSLLLFAAGLSFAAAPGFAQSPDVAQTAPLPETAYLFTSFRGNGADGLHLAWSTDGLKWTALKGDQSFLTPTVGKEKLMRDPCILQGPDGTFHMVWTDSWRDRTIGYASSKDLVTWSEQREIPVMAHEPTARNCWAPEIVYDEKRAQFLIFWSTTIPGRFPTTQGSSESDYNHRLYATTTKDFQTFTPTRLFLDPGFNCIDATLLRANGKVYMIFKDETKFPVPKKNLLLAVADDVEGPYTVQAEPITQPGTWVEGPTVLTLGAETLLYFDVYQDKRYDALRSRDLKTWEDVSAQLTLPKGTRHGTVLPVSREILAGLLAVHPDFPADALAPGVK